MYRTSWTFLVNSLFLYLMKSTVTLFNILINWRRSIKFPLLTQTFDSLYLYLYSKYGQNKRAIRNLAGLDESVNELLLIRRQSADSKLYINCVVISLIWKLVFMSIEMNFLKHTDDNRLYIKHSSKAIIFKHPLDIREKLH